MKKTILKFSVLLLCGTLAFTACKKKDTTPDDASTQQQNADDDARVQTESNAAADDANSALAGDANMSGRIAATTGLTKNYGKIVPGASSVVVDSTTPPATVTITYDGTSNINGRIRSGSISLQLTNKTQWKDTGAVITITFNNYKSTRVRDSKSIIINGTKTITNLTGGLVSTLTSASTDSVSHLIKTTGNGLTITYDDGKTATWNTYRTRSIWYTGSNYTFTWGSISLSIRELKFKISSTNAVSSYTNVAWWGTARSGDPFYAEIPTPIVWDQSVNWFGPVSGVLKLKGLTREIDVTYGVNSSGTVVTNPASNPNATLPLNPDYYEIAWTDLLGKSRTLILQY